MKLKWPIIFAIAAVILGIAAVVYISTSSPSEPVHPVTANQPATPPANNMPWILGGIALGFVAFVVWQRSTIMNTLRGMQGQPSIMDWSCTVCSSQKFGEYSLLISDGMNKSYVLDIRALLVGMHVPKGRWQNVFEEIGEGSELKFRVLTSNFMESQNSAIPILRLNSYTPKYPVSI